jgi:hypothetical protein
MYCTLIGSTLMHRHDGISAAIVGRLNCLGRQAEFGVAADTALLRTTQTKRGCARKVRKKYAPHFVICTLCYD